MARAVGPALSAANRVPAATLPRKASCHSVYGGFLCHAHLSRQPRERQSGRGVLCVCACVVGPSWLMCAGRVSRAPESCWRLSRMCRQRSGWPKGQLWRQQRDHLCSLTTRSHIHTHYLGHTEQELVEQAGWKHQKLSP